MLQLPGLQLFETSELAKQTHLALGKKLHQYLTVAWKALGVSHFFMRLPARCRLCHLAPWNHATFSTLWERHLTPFIAKKMFGAFRVWIIEIWLHYHIRNIRNSNANNQHERWLLRWYSNTLFEVIHLDFPELWKKSEGVKKIQVFLLIIDESTRMIAARSVKEDNSSVMSFSNGKMFDNVKVISCRNGRKSITLCYSSLHPIIPQQMD